jgi:Mg2+ and Co2+ transporter CorA
MLPSPLLLQTNNPPPQLSAAVATECDVRYLHAGVQQLHPTPAAIARAIPTIICITSSDHETIQDRIRTNKGRVRKMKADYLAYVLLDAIVDQYFVVLETLGEKIEGEIIKI